MKKMMTLGLMLVMLFSFSLTVNAKVSPSGTPTTEENPTDIQLETGKVPTTSPKTGESDIVLYGFGTAAVVLAAGAIVIKKRVLM